MAGKKAGQVGETLLDKEVTVRFEVTEVVAWKGKVVADDERGILLYRPYRKGVRLELVPRDAIRGVIHEIEKGPRRTQGAKAAEAEEPEADDGFDDSDGMTEDDGLDDDPDTWEDDDDDD